MFFRENARGQRGDGVTIEHRHRSLKDDRSTIEVGGHEMHSDTGNLDTVLEGLSLRSHSRE